MAPDSGNGDRFDQYEDSKSAGMSVWLMELDLIGFLATRKELEAHLEKCPEPDHPEAQQVRDHLHMSDAFVWSEPQYGYDMSVPDDDPDY